MRALVLISFGLLVLDFTDVAAQAEKGKAPTVIRSIGRIVYQNPRGELVGADNYLVSLYEVANGPDLCLDGPVGLAALTDEDGYFDFTRSYEPANFLCDPVPDVRIEFGPANSRARTPVVVDFTGGTIDFGTLRPADEMGTLDIVLKTVQIRAERWFADQGHPLVGPLPRSQYGVRAFATTDVDTRFRVDVFGETSKTLNRADWWNETVIARLFAEEWIFRNANYWDLGGCNGVCDATRRPAGSADSCGFCVWCPEDPTVAWHQGFAAWAASEIVGEFPVRYGDVPIVLERYEYPQGCASTPQTQWETPGLFAAVLNDISDGTNEHSAANPTFWDALALGPGPILDAFATGVASHPLHFFDDFREANPELCQELALTARHNGFIIDTTPPAVVTNLSSPSHSVGVASGDATVDLFWTAPPDDCETAYQFSIRWGAIPELPDTVPETRGITSWTSDVIPPGSWYFTIRGADAAGNWNGSFDTLGPIVIRNPIPANLTHVFQSGWGAFVTPRSNSASTPGDVPTPTQLDGDTASTWWNASVANVGDVPVGTGTGLWVQADGLGFFNPIDPVDHAASIPDLAAGAQYEALNLGPITVRGGRHTFGAYNDFTGLVAEADENDNAWARQWVWSPLELAVGGATTRFGPPARTGGWEGSVSTTWFNCDGINFPATATGAGWWNGVTLVANERDVDYDARLHVASTGAGDGFASNVGFSGRPADCVDAVFANRNLVGNADWDVGIIQSSDEAVLATYEVRHVTSTLEEFGVERMFSLAEFEYMSLHEVWIDTVDLGPVSFVVRCLTSNAPFNVSWLDEAFTTGGLEDYAATARSDGTGVARLNLSVSTAGYSCLVVYRDPKDGVISAEDYVIDIDVTPPDLLPDQPSGWASSLVARGSADAVPGSTPDPSSLPGWTESTWINLAVGNGGPTIAPGLFTIAVNLDGQLMVSLAPASDILPGASLDGQNIGPFEVRGGRHTLAMQIDDTDVVEEISELNNHAGRQWAWSPQTLAFGVNTDVVTPGDPFGGWEHLDWSDPALIWPNADGYRTPVFDPGGAHGFWGGVAVVPPADGDVTLRLHQALDDVDASFGEPLAFSAFGLGELDFCLLDLATLNGGQFDVGLSGGPAIGSSVVEVISSQYLDDQPAGSYGPFQLGLNELLDLHEVDLSAGFLRVHLENLGAGADLGISIHAAGSGGLGRIDAIPGGAAWRNLPGDDEWIVCEVPATGAYCIAVWKSDTGSLSESVDYRLNFATVTNTPPAEPIERTRLVGARPNPFNPRTEIHFDISSDTEVQLEVYDLRGRLVRRLLEDRLAAGRHRVVWDGLDGTGRLVGSGVYVIRLSANGHDERRKLTLLK